jgi:hypothetical protein
LRRGPGRADRRKNAGGIAIARWIFAMPNTVRQHPAFEAFLKPEGGPVVTPIGKWFEIYD